MAVAKEVMRKEFLKSIGTNPRKFVELMDELGGLEVILPELASLKNIAQPIEYHREGDAFRHSLMVLEHLPAKASLRLILAALFHDLGKANTQELTAKGKISFHRHEQKSAEHVQKISHRLRLNAELARDVAWLVKNHMLALSPDIKKIRSTILEKMFLENEKLGEDLIALSRADALASIPEKGEPNAENVDLLIKRIEEIKQTKKHADQGVSQLITGKDLIQLGLEPNKSFSKILDEIKEAQLDGKIKLKEEGLELAKKISEAIKTKKD
jgi:poly(A) polymerase